jgi:DNA modification methylase
MFGIRFFPAGHALKRNFGTAPQGRAGGFLPTRSTSTARRFSPGPYFANIPEVARTQASNRLREVRMPNFPYVDGVRLDAQQIRDLCRADQEPREISQGSVILVGRHDNQAMAVKSSAAGRGAQHAAATCRRGRRRCLTLIPMSVPSARVSRVTSAKTKESTKSLNLFASEGRVGRTSWKVLQGDCREVVKEIKPASVNCVVTSPPYYWQRDYQVAGQFGLEPSIEGFVDNLREAFAALRPALKPDATVFLNLGDTYYSAKGRPHGKDDKHRSRRLPGLRAVDGPGLGLPRKSLIGIPWRVALALQQDDWTLRSAVIWVRKSAIPEPTSKDRPWRKYEHVFIFSTGPKYYFDRSGLEGEEDVWFIEPDRRSLARGTHYAPYPRKLVERCISAGCPPGGVVLDPFLGGGTTMYVANEMGRSSIGVELNPQFCTLVADNMRALEIPKSS